MTSAEQHDQRFILLMQMRVLATVVVVLGHASSFYSGFGFSQWPNFPYIQNSAVTIFFCISGYTIAWVCHKARSYGSAGLGWFAFDRIMRLGIPLVPLLLISAFVEPLVLGQNHPHPEALSFRTLMGNMLFLQWLTPRIGDFSLGIGVQPYGLNRPLWTLALEFWTYILFAGAFFGVSGKAMRLMPIATSIVAATILGGALYGDGGGGLPMIWLLSAGLYFALQRLPPITRKTRGVALGLLPPTVALLFLPLVWPPDGGFSMAYNLLLFLSFSLLLVVMSGARQARASDPVKRFAEFAYSVYIVHYPILYLVHAAGVLPDGDVGAVLATALSLGAGWIFYLPFERNYKEMRRRIKKWLVEIFNSAKAKRAD